MKDFNSFFSNNKANFTFVAVQLRPRLTAVRRPEFTFSPQIGPSVHIMRCRVSPFVQISFKMESFFFFQAFREKAT